SAPALQFARKYPNKVERLILIEGNLISNDCGYLSRDMSAKKDDVELLQVVQQTALKMKSSQYTGWRSWAKDVVSVSANTMRDYSHELVAQSDSGELLDIFHEIQSPKLYIYGDEYLGHPIIERLDHIPKAYIEGAGHFVMTDKPDDCAQSILNM
ncbi:MAG: alpha/beta hydrolase, partial [Pseudomonadota bacterium]